MLTRLLDLIREWYTQSGVSFGALLTLYLEAEYVHVRRKAH